MHLCYLGSEIAGLLLEISFLMDGGSLGVFEFRMCNYTYIVCVYDTREISLGLFFCFYIAEFDWLKST